MLKPIQENAPKIITWKYIRLQLSNLNIDNESIEFLVVRFKYGLLRRKLHLKDLKYVNIDSIIIQKTPEIEAQIYTKNNKTTGQYFTIKLYGVNYKC